MKTKKSIIAKLLVIAAIPLIFSGCLDSLFKDNKTYYNVDDAKVEFFPLTKSVTVGAKEKDTYTLRVQLIGEQRKEDLSLGITVVDDATTAQVGIQYEAIPESVVIPAGSSIAEIKITTSGTGLAAGETVTLVLELQGTEQVEVATNLDRHTLTIQGAG